MAFMMPVVKNDWDIYNSKRSRRASECSNTNSCRSRKVSECRSEGPGSISTSPGSAGDFPSPHHRSEPEKMSSRQYARSYSASYSRTSSNSLQSPIKSTSSSPPKECASTSLNKFHSRLLYKLKKSMKHGKDEERTSS